MAGNDLAALRRLEEQVDHAVKRLRRLEQENRKLRARVRELSGRKPTTPQTKDAHAWVQERSELRRRVKRLADGLGKLLENE